MIALTRFAIYPDRCLGYLSFEDHRWYSIERPWLDNEPFISCIPEGRYTLKRVNSPRFGAGRWEVSEVPGRWHILIHTANFPHDVEGCIGLGRGVMKDHRGVSNSANAIAGFYNVTDDKDEIEMVIRQGAMIA